MQFGAEAAISGRMAELEQASLEEMARLDGDADAPVGAGGEAASRAAARD